MGGVSRGPFIMASKRASYTVTFKLKVVEDRAAAMEYRVKEKQVRETGDKKKTPSAAYRNNLEIFDFCLKKGVRLILRCGL